MKLTAALLIIIISLLISKTSTAQSQSELIIQFNHFNVEKQLDSLKNIISGYKALKLVDYCHHLSCALIKVDRGIQPDDARFLQALKDADFQFEIKSNATFAQVLSTCRDSKNVLTDKK